MPDLPPTAGDAPARQELRPYSGDVAPDFDPCYDPEADPTVRSIGVMGAAGGLLNLDARRRSYELGAAIARAGCVLITGACPGLPYDSARGARDAIQRIGDARPFTFEAPVTMELDFARAECADFVELMPGFERIGGRTIRFAGDDYAMVFRAFLAALRLGSAALTTA